MKRFTLALIVFALASCGSKPEAAKSSEVAAAVPVSVAAASMVDWPSEHVATGTVRARFASAISSRLAAYVREVRVEQGSSVTEGQVLAVLDGRDLEIALRKATALRDEVRSAIPESDAAIAAAVANADLARSTERRMSDLLSKNSISAQEFDEAAARAKAAVASVAMARARRAQLDSRLAQMEQEIQNARLQQAYAEIRSPFVGVVVGKTAETGMFAAPGLPLFQIEKSGPFRLEATVDEQALAGIRPGELVRVALDGGSQPFAARVAEIVPVIDANSRTGTVKIDLPGVPGLRSGLFGRVTFSKAAERRLTVDARAVVERGSLQAVFIVTNGKAHNRLITVGRRDASRAEVLSGLSDGEAVVAPVPATLTDGTPVTVRPGANR